MDDTTAQPPVDQAARRGRGWIWFCSIPFWLLLASAVAIVLTEDPSPVRFAATVGGGAGISGALIGLVVGVGAMNRRSLARAPDERRQAQATTLAVIAGAAAVVAVGAGAAVALGQGAGAVVLAGTATLVAVSALTGAWRRRTGRR